MQEVEKRFAKVDIRECEKVSAPFVFIKPHAVNDKVKALVKETLQSNGIKIISEGCISGKVAFHPFKDVDTYFKCMDEARAIETSSSTSTRTATIDEATTTPPQRGSSADARAHRQARWLVDDTDLQAPTLGLAFRRTPQRNDTIDGEWVNWGDTITGTLSEDGEWLQVGKLFLPMRLGGARVLLRQELWVADNSQLQDVAAGLGYRSSPSLDDKLEGETVMWGDLVEGSPSQNGAWLRVGRKYLPMRLQGVPVLRRQEPESYHEGEALHKEVATGAPGDHAAGGLRVAT